MNLEQMNTYQHTINKEVSLSGIGLHTGQNITIALKPAPPNTGIVFIKDDVKIPAKLCYVSSSYRGISLKKDGTEIRTIEHLLGSLSFFFITNLFIELNGPEIPIMDGSSLPFALLIKSAGIKKQDGRMKYLSFTSPVEIKEDGRSISILPYNGFKVSYTISFSHPVVKEQSLELEIDETSFIKEIAPARTFGFLDEVNSLRQAGLIKGGSLENAIVVSDDEIINEPLRYEDEFVRHKILDLIGDLSLLGIPLKGHIIANCSGHSLNIKLARRIEEMVKKNEGIVIGEGRMDIKEILGIIPHRYPFLLIDRILEIEPAKRVVGIKNVTMNEEFFQGHFPGNPVMPGVLVIEAMAQTAGVLLLSEEENRGKLVYLAGLDNVRFRKPVIPGDQIRFEAIPVKIRKKVGMVEVKGWVDGELVAEATLLFSLGV
ncbi:MAG: UDP-3-O-acyl-N-acetylglucosamine deacetylase [bacterium]